MNLLLEIGAEEIPAGFHLVAQTSNAKAAFEDPVGDEPVAQSHHRSAGRRHIGERQDEPGRERALANAPAGQ